MYSYSSPKEDEAYLILKGSYQVNKTESKEVTYQVPFRVSCASGDGSYVEINNNHRYTLAITDADDYHLDFTLHVADWTDDGSIDDYTPGTDTGAIDIKIPAGDAETQYDAHTHIVTMSLNPGTTFDADALEAEVYCFPSSNPKTGYRVKTAGKTLTLTAYSMFAPPRVETGYASDYGTANTGWLPQPTAPTTSGYGDNRKKFTYDIVVPVTESTDKEYQLHKGTISVKQGTTELKKLTLWRGASNIPYPSSRSDHAYYSAVKYGDLWWAPMNLGASEVAKNATSLSSIGKLYQWGRKVATFYEGGKVVTGPTTHADATDEFITGSSANDYDWLSPKNDNLWVDASGKKTDRDPCPSGWRVPTIDELGKWVSGSWSEPLLTIDGQNGINLVLPAAGCRSYDSGTSSDQGIYGYYWSSSVTGTYARDVGFGGGMVNDGYRYRAFGFSVRCVQE